ncbi:MAG: hypothetical protein ACFFD1_14775 [Candidatus Thorarchaeota archaeon]
MKDKPKTLDEQMNDLKRDLIEFKEEVLKILYLPLVERLTKLIERFL